MQRIFDVKHGEICYKKEIGKLMWLNLIFALHF